MGKLINHRPPRRIVEWEEAGVPINDTKSPKAGISAPAAVGLSRPTHTAGQVTKHDKDGAIDQ